MHDYAALAALPAVPDAGTFAGIARGMNPEPLVADAIADARLLEIVPGSAMDVPLYRQTPRTLDGTIDALSGTVRRVAKAHLARPASGHAGREGADRG